MSWDEGPGQAVGSSWNLRVVDSFFPKTFVLHRWPWHSLIPFAHSFCIHRVIRLVGKEILPLRSKSPSMWAFPHGIQEWFKWWKSGTPGQGLGNTWCGAVSIWKVTFLSNPMNDLLYPSLSTGEATTGKLGLYNHRKWQGSRWDKKARLKISSRSEWWNVAGVSLLCFQSVLCEQCLFT